MGSSQAAPSVAVAVVSFNERELLAACLRSLEADAKAGRAEVWVVDNASTDGSPAMVDSEFPWVSLIASENNVGYGVAVNLVAERTTSDWIAPANQDLELAPDALERMVAAGGHPAICGRSHRPDHRCRRSNLDRRRKN